ncbi:MAG: cytochrome c3 family protein [Coriobacteriia bacterium]|nr:cytochrome c3 family protein [Coriobacteriia bacterium]
MKTTSSRKKLVLLGSALLVGIAIFLISACAPQKIELPTDGYDDDDYMSISFTWTAQLDCSVCHKSQGDSMRELTNLAGYHFNLEDMSCIDCHDDSSGLKEVHDSVRLTATEVEMLQKTEVGEQLCLSCHDLGEVAAKTPQGSFLEDILGLIVNPHDVPQTEGHEDVNSCLSCHTGHTSESVFAQAKKNCFACHHHEVFECGTCH